MENKNLLLIVGAVALVLLVVVFNSVKTGNVVTGNFVVENGDTVWLKDGDYHRFETGAFPRHHLWVEDLDFDNKKATLTIQNETKRLSVGQSLQVGRLELVLVNVLKAGLIWPRQDTTKFRVIIHENFSQTYGNGIVEAGELCDDGNLNYGDRCVLGECYNPDFGEDELFTKSNVQFYSVEDFNYMSNDTKSFWRGIVTFEDGCGLSSNYTAETWCAGNLKTGISGTKGSRLCSGGYSCVDGACRPEGFDLVVFKQCEPYLEMCAPYFS